MPELPEVQTIVDDLRDAGFIGAVITRARVYWPRTIAVPEPVDFCRRIKNRRIEDLKRRGKYIVFTLSGPLFLLVHLRMTGRFFLSREGVGRSSHEHVILSIDGGTQLRFHDVRKFGRMWLVRRTEAILGRLGPEPMDRRFTAAELFKRTRRRRRRLKPLLLDQSFLSGLGNIYVDEALWEACLHPEQRASHLSPDDVRRLHRAVRKVLRRGIRHAGTTFSSGMGGFASIRENRGENSRHLKVFRRTTRPCSRCGEPIQRIVVAQRSTHFCAVCQKARYSFTG